MDCEYCGYTDFFEVEPDSGRYYCVHCGAYNGCNCWEEQGEG